MFWQHAALVQAVPRAVRAYSRRRNLVRSP